MALQPEKMKHFHDDLLRLEKCDKVKNKALKLHVKKINEMTNKGEHAAAQNLKMQRQDQKDKTLDILEK